MTSLYDISAESIIKLYHKLFDEAEKFGYHLNPDAEFTKDLVRSLIINETRYGYRACPCRLADGIKQNDLDIICPCDYRDKDIAEYDACYCGLYVSKKILSGETIIKPIPERRPSEDERKIKVNVPTGAVNSQLSLPVWRCAVCGYLCAREEPPEVCPICKVSKERFERFM